MATKLYISEVNRTNLLRVGSLRISKDGTSAHTASFRLRDLSTTPYYPVPGEHIRIEDGEELLFAGQIESSEIDVMPGPSKAVVHTIHCTDYTRLLSHYLVTGIWENVMATDIIKDIFTPGHYCCDIAGNPDFGVIGEGIVYHEDQPGILIEYYPVQSRTVYDVIEELARLSEYKWRLDYNKELRFYSKDTFIAPIVISATSRNFRKMTNRRHLEEYANEVIVIGATGDTAPQLAEYRGDGTKTVFSPNTARVDDKPVAFNILDIVTSDEIPTGCIVIDTSYPEGNPNRESHKILALQGSAEDADFYFSQGSMDITTAPGATPLTSRQILRVQYIGEFTVWTTRTALEAVSERHAIEGGMALYQTVEQDPTVMSMQVAGSKAESILKAKKDVPRVVTFETDQEVEPSCTQLEPGQLLQILLEPYQLGQRDKPYLPDYFTIQSIDIEDVSGAYLRYKVECVGSETTSWEDTWRKLAQQQRLVRATSESTCVQVMRRLGDELAVSDGMDHSSGHFIPWVGSGRVGFCEFISGIEYVDVYISPMQRARYIRAR